MKKLLLLLLITPLFFACKHNTASGTQGPVTACSTSSDCENNTNGKTVCHNGECVDPSLLNVRACSVDDPSIVLNGLGDVVETCTANETCSSGSCVPVYRPAGCTSDSECASGSHCAANGLCVLD